MSQKDAFISIYRYQKSQKAAIISVYRWQKSRKVGIISIYHQQKSQKCTRFFFNHLDLPPAKVALMLFCKKLSRFIASKS